MKANDNLLFALSLLMFVSNALAQDQPGTASMIANGASISPALLSTTHGVREHTGGA